MLILISWFSLCLITAEAAKVKDLFQVPLHLSAFPALLGNGCSGLQSRKRWLNQSQMLTASSIIIFLLLFLGNTRLDIHIIIYLKDQAFSAMLSVFFMCMKLNVFSYSVSQWVNLSVSTMAWAFRAPADPWLHHSLCSGFSHSLSTYKVTNTDPPSSLSSSFPIASQNLTVPCKPLHAID